MCLSVNEQMTERLRQGPQKIIAYKVIEYCSSRNVHMTPYCNYTLQLGETLLSDRKHRHINPVDDILDDRGPGRHTVKHGIHVHLSEEAVRNDISFLTNLVSSNVHVRVVSVECCRDDFVAAGFFQHLSAVYMKVKVLEVIDLDEVKDCEVVNELLEDAAC